MRRAISSFILAGALLALLPCPPAAAVTCEGQDLIGLVWENGEFTYNDPPTFLTAELILYNPSAASGRIGGFEVELVLPLTLALVEVQLPPMASNYAVPPVFKVAFSSQQLAAPEVVLARMTFIVAGVDFQSDVLARPVAGAIVPGTITYADGSYGLGIRVPLTPVSGDVDEPIARLDGPALVWCSEVHEFGVDISLDGDVGNRAGTTFGASDGYDIGTDLFDADVGRSLWFPHPEWGEALDYFQTDLVGPYDASSEVRTWRFATRHDNAGSSSTIATIDFAPSFGPGDGVGLVLHDLTSDATVDLFPSLSYSYVVPPLTAGEREFELSIGLYGWSEQDTDADGIDDVVDACPDESGAWFDSDGDGCPDPLRCARHVEYWSRDALPLTYVVNELGAPGIGDGSDLAAVQAGFAAWSTIPGAEVAVGYGGTTSQADARALDLVNLVTFRDPDFVFPAGVIAVGLSTSFLAPVGEGAGYRPGQIVDSDMIFNPGEAFGTPTAGSGIDIQSVVTHEAGHMLGLSHSAVVTSTMFYVLPPGREAATPTAEDRLAMLRSYPSDTALAERSHLRGAVTDGRTGLPVPGVAVFAIADGGETLGCDYTLPGDGSYHFLGLPDGLYHVAIHPLDRSAAIGYLTPANINQLIYRSAVTAVVPEWYDAAESASDDAAARTPVAVAAGTETVADLVTNIDQTGPTVLEISPAPDAEDVAVDAAVLVRFSEPIDGESLRGNFLLTRFEGMTLLPGNAALVEDGRTLAYVPRASLLFDTNYEIIVSGGVSDLFGNEMGDDVYLAFHTEAQPPTAITGLCPAQGPAGSVLVINGTGFSADPASNEVSFDDHLAPILRASPSALVIEAPATGSLGPVEVNVHNLEAEQVSNTLTFNVLPPDESARGLEVASIDLGAMPRRVAVGPDGALAFVATAAGLSVVGVADPGALVHTPLAVAGGLNDLDVMPDGSAVFAVGGDGDRLCRFQPDPPLLLNELTLPDKPLGIAIDPAGRRAYLATGSGAIQVWDVRPGSASFERQVGTIDLPDRNLLGPITTDPTGRLLLALTGTGRLLVIDPGLDSLLASVPVLPDPHDLAVDPTGRLAFVTDGGGSLAIVDLELAEMVLEVPTGGRLEGIDLTATGTFAYAVNHELDELEVIDLRAGSVQRFRLGERLPQRVNPVDVAFGPSGRFAYSIVERDRRLVVMAAGDGPVLVSLSPRSGPEGARVVLSGVGFTGATVWFNGVPATVERPGELSLTAVVPAGATGGPVTVLGTGPGEVSNPLPFEVLGQSPQEALRLATAMQPGHMGFPTSAFALTPDGKLVVLGTEGGSYHLLDTDPASPTFWQLVGSGWATTARIDDIAVSPDATTAYFVSSQQAGVFRVNIDRDDPDFGGVQDPVPVAASLGRLDVSPDGRHLFGFGETLLWLVDAETGAVLANPLQNAQIEEAEVAYHPGGAYAYVAIREVPVAGPEDPNAGLAILDVADPAAPGFGQLLGWAPNGAVDTDNPICLDFTPDGRTCYVMTNRFAGDAGRYMVALDCSDPADPFVVGTALAGSATLDRREQVNVSPNGDRVMLTIWGSGMLHLDLDLGLREYVDTDFARQALGIGYVPGGGRVLMASALTDSVYIYDLAAAQRLEAVWGEWQRGVAGETAPTPLRVRVTEAASQLPVVQAPVSFRILSGGGRFPSAAAGAEVTELVVGTDSHGYAELKWELGPDLGLQAVEIVSEGAAGSPLVFEAEAVADPLSQPLQLIADLTAPAAGEADVGVTTAVQIVFNRAVDPASVVGGAFYLSADDGLSTLPAALGVSDTRRRLSLTPLAPLDYSRRYTVVVGAGIRGEDGSPLENPGVTTFTSEAPPPAPLLRAVSPPSGVPAQPVVLSGLGFASDARDNDLRFNGAAAPVLESDAGFLGAVVPLEATTGAVELTVDGQVSNPLPFQVLVPSLSPADDVVATIPTGSAARAVTISPDGTMAYAVCPEADVLVPIDLETFTTLPGVPVGDEPWAVVVHPDGDYAYVANRASADVSIVDLRDGSLTRHRTIATLPVGLEPVDVVVSPGGDRVVVACSGSQELGVIDSDRQSSAFHRVIATVGVGSSARAVAISPDGARIFVGTEVGYLVLGAVDYGILGRVDQGTAVRSLTISPDGTILVVVDMQGAVNLFDVVPGSDLENQVIATAPAGSAARMASISPDGALLYVVLEEDDLILVFSLDLSVGMAALAPDASRPPLTLQLVARLTAGENPQYLAIDPTGSGMFLVCNAGDLTVMVFGDLLLTEGSVSGTVTAACPGAGTPLAGVELDIFAGGSGDLVHTLRTDSLGRYEATLPVGPYVLTLLTPLGFTVPAEEVAVTVTGGGGETVDWALLCSNIVPSQRNMSYWKHQIGLALSGNGPLEIAPELLCRYLDLIEVHFNSNLLNPVVVYDPPESDDCVQKLLVAQDLFKVNGDEDALIHARQELMALLFNVASGKLSLRQVISEDGATVTKAITFVDGMIDDGLTRNDELAMQIAKDINKGKLVRAGVIPLRTPSIWYAAPRRFHLAQSYPNPFNPTATISYDVAAPVRVRLRIHDLAGRLVRTLVDEDARPGTYEVIWDGKDGTGRRAAAGVYFCRLEAGDFTSTRKMVMIK